MSLGLVAYDSSDESGNSDEEENDVQNLSLNVTRSIPENRQQPFNNTSDSSPTLHSATENNAEPHISDDDDDFYGGRPNSGLNLPPPKHQNVSSKSSAQNLMSDETEKQTGSSLLLGLPTPRSDGKPTPSLNDEDELEEMVRAKPAEIAIREKPPPSKKKIIKITAPSLSAYDSDEDEPVSKKPKPSKGGSKLFSLLPEPKNKSVKEVGRSLIPHTLTRRNTAPVAKQLTQKRTVPSTATNASRSTVADDDSDGEMDNTNFFSIGTEIKPSDEHILSSASSFTATSSSSSLPPVRRHASQEEDAPLKFSRNTDVRLPQGPSHVTPQLASSSVTAAYGGGQSSYQLYPTSSQEYNLADKDEEAYFKEQAALAAAQADGEAPLVPADELKRLQGKRLFGKEEINLIDINAEDAIDRTELLKNLTEETNAHAHSRQFKANAPNTTSRRKHQITYLAHQAKQMELDLKNQWANNRMTKRQTQAKYGF